MIKLKLPVLIAAVAVVGLSACNPVDAIPAPVAHILEIETDPGPAPEPLVDAADCDANPGDVAYCTEDRPATSVVVELPAGCDQAELDAALACESLAPAEVVGAPSGDVASGDTAVAP